METVQQTNNLSLFSKLHFLGIIHWQIVHPDPLTLQFPSTGEVTAKMVIIIPPATGSGPLGVKEEGLYMITEKKILM